MAYTFTDVQMGVPDINSVIVSPAVGTPGIGALPSVTMEAALGEVREGFDATLGRAKFMFLKVPTSTTVTTGLLYQFDKLYTIVVVPAGSTSLKTGVSVVAAVNTVASNASAVQYTWFLIQGTTAVLKTAVAVAAQSALYMSATAGRFYVTSSAGKQILNARTQNTSTVTSTTSSVNVFLNYSCLEGA